MPFSNSSPLSVLHSFILSIPSYSFSCTFIPALSLPLSCGTLFHPLWQTSYRCVWNYNKNIVITCTSAHNRTHTQAQGFHSMTLLNKVIIIGGKKLSACGENDTTANEDCAMTSSMSIRDWDREVNMSNERLKEQKVPRGEQVDWFGRMVRRGATGAPAELQRWPVQADESSDTCERSQTSIHQLLVLLEHLYLWAILSVSQPIDWCRKHFPSKPLSLCLLS